MYMYIRSIRTDQSQWSSISKATGTFCAALRPNGTGASRARLRRGSCEHATVLQLSEASSEPTWRG